MGVYPWGRFYITITNFRKVDVHLLKDQNVGEVANAPVEIVYIKNRCYFPSLAQMQTIGTAQSTTHATSLPQLLGTYGEAQNCQIERHKNRQGRLARGRTATRQIWATPSRPLKLRTELKSVWDGRHRCINVSKHLINLNHDKSKPFHTVLYRAGLTVEQFVTAEINRMLTGKAIEPATTEFAELILFTRNKNGLL